MAKNNLTPEQRKDRDTEMARLIVRFIVLLLAAYLIGKGLRLLFIL